jgi:hypothetical protein
MPRVGFEPAIPVFERAKTVHALDCAATVIGTGSTNNLLSLSFFMATHARKQSILAYVKVVNLPASA